MLIGPFLFPGTQSVMAQTSLGQQKHKADQAFEKGEYRLALQYYRQAGIENSKDKQAKMRMGICAYEVNDVESSIRMFQSLIQEGKTETDVFYHMARSCQSMHLFTEAITYYKNFLQECKPQDPRQAQVKDELIRCANAIRYQYGDEIAYVENAGTTINTQEAEFGVKTSPTSIDRIYFNSSRVSDNPGTTKKASSDIYSATLVNGRWSSPTLLPSHINSSGYEEVCGFSTNGQVLYYFTPVQKTFAIRTDTFSIDADKTYKGIFKGPFPAGQGTDLMLFNDTVCLFASDKLKGFGGYDLFISLWDYDHWTAPANLGPSINTSFDERHPFLTRNGMTLYYSSNSVASVGGFDIFSASFEPDLAAWNPSLNLGFPVNSPLDDRYLVLAPDGMTAYLSSNRKEGYGTEDIYRVFFKQPVLAHQQISSAATFYHVLMQKGEDTIATPVTTVLPAEIKEYYISHLYFDENTEILSPQNIKKLDLLVNLMQIYPNIKAELSCFELPSGQRTFNLYFSIKKAEEAMDYLVRKGIPRDRIWLKGYGSSFPLAGLQPGQAPSPVFTKLNQRVEITLHDYINEPVKIIFENIAVPENLADPKGVKFRNLREQLYYSVQIASITQILQNPNLESIEEVFIEVDNTQGNYLYMAGMVSTFKEAEKVRSAMVSLGFVDAKIFPYVNGKRIEPGNITTLSKAYPDLLLYQEALKN